MLEFASPTGLSSATFALVGLREDGVLPGGCGGLEGTLGLFVGGGRGVEVENAVGMVGLPSPYIPSTKATIRSTRTTDQCVCGSYAIVVDRPWLQVFVSNAKLTGLRCNGSKGSPRAIGRLRGLNAVREHLRAERHGRLPAKCDCEIRRPRRNEGRKKGRGRSTRGSRARACLGVIATCCTRVLRRAYWDTRRPPQPLLDRGCSWFPADS